MDSRSFQLFLVAFLFLAVPCLRAYSPKTITTKDEELKFGAPIGTHLEVDEGTGLYRPFSVSSKNTMVYEPLAQKYWHHYCRADLGDFFRPKISNWCRKLTNYSSNWRLYLYREHYESLCCDGQQCVCKGDRTSCHCLDPQQKYGLDDAVEA